MSGSKEIANLRNRLTALENNPSPQTVPEAANPITSTAAKALQGVADIGGKAVQGVRNLFKAKLKPDATAALEINGKPIQFKLENGIWKRVDRNGNLKVATNAEKEAAEAAALKDVRQHATAASPQHAAPTSPTPAPGAPANAAAQAASAVSPEVRDALKLAMIKYEQKIPYVKGYFGIMAASDLADWNNARQNHDEEGELKSAKKFLANALGVPFPITTALAQLAWLYYKSRLDAPFTPEDEAYIAKTVTELDKNNTPPDPNKIEAKLYQRIKNDYEKLQKQKNSPNPTTPAAATPAQTTTTPTSAANPTATATTLPVATPPRDPSMQELLQTVGAITPNTSTAAPTPTPAASPNDAEELRAMLKAAGLSK